MEPSSAQQPAVSREPSPLGAARWLENHRPLVLGGVIALSIAVRVVYFVQLSAGPCVWQHRFAQSDMNFFDIWAQRIADGDWLTDRSLHPHHNWHKLVADRYFAEHPEELATIERVVAADGIGVEPARVLWDRWYGGKRFHQEPLYSYVIALTYKLLGPDVRWVFAWQMLLGVASNALVYILARRYFGDPVALVAAVLAVLCGPVLFYEMVLLRSTLITFTGLVLAYLAEVALKRTTWHAWLAIGVAFGAALTLKTSFVLLLVGLVCVLAYRHRRQTALMGRCVAAMIAGVVAGLAPVIGRNLAVGAPVPGLSSIGAITFINASAEDFPLDEGFYVSFKHAPRIMGATGGRFYPAIIGTLRTHESAASYVRQLWGKFSWLWHWYEQPNNVNFYYYRLHAGILRYLPVTFLIVGPLGLVGLALAVWRRSPCAPLYLMVISTVIPMLGFYVVSRFRAPLLAALLPFAALTLVRMVEWLRANRRMWGLVTLAAMLALARWTARPLPADRLLIRYSDCVAAHRVHYDRLESDARAAGRWRRVADVLGEALRYEPVSVHALGPEQPARTLEEHLLATWFAGIHQRYAEALDRLGHIDAAAEQRRRAGELSQAARAFELPAAAAVHGE